MDDEQLDRVSTAAGLAAYLAVGVPVAVEQVVGAGELVGAHPWWFWTAFAIHAGVLLAFELLPDEVGWPTARSLLAVQVAAGVAVFALSPGFGFTSVLLVISAASAAYILSPRGAIGVVALQTAVVGGWLAVLEVGWIDVLLPTLVYGCFQLFAVMVVVGQRREMAARERLAEVNAQLQAATARLAATSRDEERLRIARELHDLVGHQLTALTLNLEVATHRRGEGQQAAVEQARDVAKELLAAVREAVGDLRHPPPSVRAAVEAIAARVPRPRVHVEVDDLAVDPERAAAVVRCVQEIVTNAVRHSDADHLWLRIERDPDGALRIAANDDGRGAARVVAGNGLTGMRERMAALGGELHYTTAPDEGFAVSARLPAGATP